MGIRSQPASILTLGGGLFDYPLLLTRETAGPTDPDNFLPPTGPLSRDILENRQTSWHFSSCLETLGLGWACTNNLQVLTENPTHSAIDHISDIEKILETFISNIKPGHPKRLRFGDLVTIAYLPQSEGSKDHVLFQTSLQANKNFPYVLKLLNFFSTFIDQINVKKKFAKGLDLITALSPFFIKSVKDWVIELEKGLDQERLAVFNHPYIQKYLLLPEDKREAFPIDLYNKLIAPVVCMADDIYNRVDFLFNILKLDKNKAAAQEVVGFMHDFRHRVANLASLGGMWEEDVQDGLPLALEALVPKSDLESILIGVEVSHRAFAAQQEVLVLRDAPARFSNVTVKKFDFAKLLMRMLSNLVQNGIKYGDHGNGLLLLKFVILKVEEDENHLYFSVEDNGRGLSKEDKTNIGVKGWRAATVKDIKGNGYGISNVMSDAKSADGELQIESLEGSGSTFRIKLPKKHFSFERLQTDLDDLPNNQIQPDDFMIAQPVNTTDVFLNSPASTLLMPPPLFGGVFMPQTFMH